MHHRNMYCNLPWNFHMVHIGKLARLQQHLAWVVPQILDIASSYKTIQFHCLHIYIDCNPKKILVPMNEKWFSSQLNFTYLAYLHFDFVWRAYLVCLTDTFSATCCAISWRFRHCVFIYRSVIAGTLCTYRKSAALVTFASIAIIFISLIRCTAKLGGRNKTLVKYKFLNDFFFFGSYRWNFQLSLISRARFWSHVGLRSFWNFLYLCTA